MSYLGSVIRPLLRYHSRRTVASLNVSWAAAAPGGFHSNQLQVRASRPSPRSQSRLKTTEATGDKPCPPTAKVQELKGPSDHPDATAEDEGPTEQPGQGEAGQQEPNEGLQASLTTRPELEPRRSQVLILWDLDNKPPGAHAADAVESLRNLASKYGEVTAIHAYANRYAFVQSHPFGSSRRKTERNFERDYEPLLDDLDFDFGEDLMDWEREQSLNGNIIALDPGEGKGNVTKKNDMVFRCGVCGQRLKTDKKLKRHMKTLHQRERNKKMNHIASMKSAKKKAKLWDRYGASLEKYALASTRMSNPETVGLKQDLRNAGVNVQLVSDAAEAADGAIRREFKAAARKRVEWVCLVSDDKGFAGALEKAKKHNMKTIVIGGKKATLRHSATVSVSWDKVLQEY